MSTHFKTYFVQSAWTSINKNKFKVNATRPVFSVCVCSNSLIYNNSFKHVFYVSADKTNHH